MLACNISTAVQLYKLLFLIPAIELYISNILTMEQKSYDISVSFSKETGNIIRLMPIAEIRPIHSDYVYKAQPITVVVNLTKDMTGDTVDNPTPSAIIFSVGGVLNTFRSVNLVEGNGYVSRGVSDVLLTLFCDSKKIYDATGYPSSFISIDPPANLSELRVFSYDFVNGTGKNINFADYADGSHITLLFRIFSERKK